MDLMDNYNGWKDHMVKQLFILVEAQKILQIPIIDKNQPDNLIWDGKTSDGNYTVKIGYQAIMDWRDHFDNNNVSSSSNYNNIWGKIWKLRVPPKHTHLLWRILRNALHVKDNLFKKGVKCDPLCPKCGDYKETLSHVFLECEWVKQVWLASPLTINLNATHDPNIIKWIYHMAMNTSTESMEFITSTIYSIWYARNQMVFRESYLPPSDVSTRAIAHLHEYHQHGLASSSTSRSNVTVCSGHNTSWSPPHRGIQKINVDAHLSSDGHWFSGLLLRRSDGSTVEAATRSHFGSANAVLGESLGLGDALDMVEAYNATNVIFELDSLIVVNAVKNKTLIRRE
ncbi:hypothetical protein QL285_074691 [Trifolium repens]|nr:hypothetical protein QL285_074691 [Trifolium repens]